MHCNIIYIHSVYPENMKSSDAETNEEAPCDLKCGENARCERSSNGQQSCVCNHQFKGNPSNACVLECRSHSDCPTNTVCFSDLKCRDPCIHSIRCGQGALCRVDNAFPVCFCPENFVGDPKIGCIDNIQQGN